jgi:hypothetical protein
VAADPTPVRATRARSASRVADPLDASYGRGMSHHPPHFSWDEMRDGPEQDGRRVVAVPVDVTALDARAVALLQARLVMRCAALETRLVGGERTAITFVGAPSMEPTEAFRRAADEAIASVSADSHAGWTAADELERGTPFTWD